MDASKSECPEDIVGVQNESAQHALLWYVDYFELRTMDGDLVSPKETSSPLKNLS